MKTPSFKERFQYWFDNIMSKGTIALIGLLALVTLLLIIVVAIVVEVFNLFPPGSSMDDLPFPELVWNNLMRAMDAGTVAGDLGYGYRAAMLFVTLAGILVVATLIGIVSTAFNTKVENLRNGSSRVLETDHTLILGWSQKIFPIISEVCIANESRKRATIVILADRDKVEMEEEIRAHIPNTGKTTIIVRSGDPMNLTDLDIANPHTARSIVIVAPENDEDPDSVIIKTTLALTNNPRRKTSDYHIVGEIQDARNLEAARLVGRHEAHWVLANELISRITVQSCRQSGLSVVYTELLDFDGDEIYFTIEPTLVGKSYIETQLAFSDSTVIGMVKAGAVHINPDADLTYENGDQLIVIAEDDSVITVDTPGVPDPLLISTKKGPEFTAEQTLILGYNSGINAMLAELDEYVAPGSSVTVVADLEEPAFATFDNMTLTYRRGDTTSRALLESLEFTQFEHIIVLAYKDTLGAQRADAKTLVTLLHLRDMAEIAGVDNNVVSEMLDDRNRELAEVTKADDFIVSDKLISLMLSQVSENKQLTDVFETLFSSEGSEIYLRPADLYVTPGETVDFYTVVEAARRRGETALGYRIEADARSSAANYGVTVNPNKRGTRSYAADDKIIVLAND